MHYLKQAVLSLAPIHFEHLTLVNFSTFMTSLYEAVDQFASSGLASALELLCVVNTDFQESIHPTSHSHINVL